MAINSRNKGASSEREFCNLVLELSGVRLIRNLEQSRSGGFDLVVHSEEVGDVADTFRNLAIECKRYRKVTPGLIKTWWQQAKDQAELQRLHPALAYRADRHEWQVLTPLHLINRSLTENLSIEACASVSVRGFCTIIRDIAAG